MPTCQISTLTFTTRYHVIYYCGWWCRGSTHLQIQWQGQIAYKTLQKSLPVYGVSTYMDGESTEATDAVISSSCMQIIGMNFQNPGNTEMYIISVVRLRIRPVNATPAWNDRCTLNDNSSFTQLDINSTCSTLKNNTHMAHTCTSKDMYPYSNILPSQPISAFSQWYFWILLYMASQPLHTASFLFYFYISSWMSQIIDLWLENTQFGMLQ